MQDREVTQGTCSLIGEDLAGTIRVMLRMMEYRQYGDGLEMSENAPAITNLLLATINFMTRSGYTEWGVAQYLAERATVLLRDQRSVALIGRHPVAFVARALADDLNTACVEGANANCG